mgnify:CR=1 FL=1
MKETLKIVCFAVLIILFLPIYIGGRIPESIEGYFAELLVVIVLILLILFFLCINDSGKKKNIKTTKKPDINTSESTHIFDSKVVIKDKETCSTYTPPTTKVGTSQTIIQKKVSAETENVPNKVKTTKRKSTLTIKQRCALLKVAVDFCHCSPERHYLWKGQYEILLEFTKTLKLKEDHLLRCIHEVSESFFMSSEDSVKTSDYYEVVKTIHQDEPFIQFINTCDKLLNLLDSLSQEQLETECYAYLVFPEILRDIGFTQEEIDRINHGEVIYRFKKECKVTKTEEVKTEPLPAVKESFPVSKEQMAIFKESWTLPQFRESFGIENRIEDRTNHTRKEGYKVCIFVNGSKETEVGFSNSLGYPSIEEIQKREKELMVGLSYYGNYKLYDNKIMSMVEIPMSL